METVRIYVHHAGEQEPISVEAEPSTSLREAIGGADGDTVVLLEDEDELLDLERSLEAAGIGDRAHVFAGKRQRIAVQVVFNGESRERTFGASTRFDRVFKWATGNQGFDLDRADAAEHVLALCSTGAIPAGDAHVGTLDEATPGEACFNLIPKNRFEG